MRADYSPVHSWLVSQVPRLCASWFYGYTAFLSPCQISRSLDFGVSSVTRFLTAEKSCFHLNSRHLINFQGEHVRMMGMCEESCSLFNEGRRNVHDEKRSERPTAMNEDLTQKVDQEILQNRRQTVEFFDEGIQKLVPQLQKYMNTCIEE